MTNLLMDAEVKVTMNEVVLFGTVNDITPNGRYIHIETVEDMFVIDTTKAIVELVEKEEEVTPKAKTERLMEIKQAVKAIDKLTKYADEFEMKVNVFEFEEDEHGFEVEISLLIDGEREWLHMDTYGDLKAAMRRARHIVKTLVDVNIELCTMDVEHYCA